MVAKHTLPERRNPLLDPIDSNATDILVERRRLGQTNLSMKAGMNGLTNTKPETFDYAHLRAPLPKDLSGSGIFTLSRSSAFPESYFLMRRSNDGFVNATGMFKAAFPWALQSEEDAERKYQRSFPSAVGEPEMAGSIWIAPEEALALSDDYSMRHWIEALLDPEPIEKGNKDKANTQISLPPQFDLETCTPAQLPPRSGRASRGRSARSVSPAKAATPARKMATPRKPRTAKSAKTSEKTQVEDVFTSPQVATPSTALQNMVANGASPSTNGEDKAHDDEVKEGTVRIEVNETVETNGNVQTRSTNVTIDVPHNHPALPEPEDPAAMIEEAKKMVETAQKLDAKSSGDMMKISKRKVGEILDGAELALERPSKKAYTTEEKLTKEKVTRRALVGLGVMAAVGTAVQYFF